METAIELIRTSYVQARLSPDPDSITADSPEFVLALVLLNAIIVETALDPSFPSAKLLQYKNIAGVRGVLEIVTGNIINLSPKPGDAVQVVWDDGRAYISFRDRLDVQGIQARNQFGLQTNNRVCWFGADRLHLDQPIGPNDYGGGEFTLRIPHYPPPAPLENPDDPIPEAFDSSYLALALTSRLGEKEIIQRDLLPSHQAREAEAYRNMTFKSNKRYNRRLGLGDSFAPPPSDVREIDNNAN